MCAEQVQTEAIICRFCGHQFSDPAELLPVPSRPTGRPPEIVIAALRNGEELFVWSECYINYGRGLLAITNLRILFFTQAIALTVDQELAVRRRGIYEGSPTRPDGCRPDGTVVLVFPDQRLDFHGLNPELAKEILATVIPEFAGEFFAEDRAMLETLAERHLKLGNRQASSTERRTSVELTFGGVHYVGGWSGLASDFSFEGELVFGPDSVVFRVGRRDFFAWGPPAADQVEIGDRGGFAYVAFGMSNGQTAVFEIPQTNEISLHAQLSEWLAEH